MRDDYLKRNRLSVRNVQFLAEFLMIECVYDMQQKIAISHSSRMGNMVLHDLRADELRAEVIISAMFYL